MNSSCVHNLIGDPQVLFSANPLVLIHLLDLIHAGHPGSPSKQSRGSRRGKKKHDLEDYAHNEHQKPPDMLDVVYDVHDGIADRVRF
jgi:hypothetical protein